MAAGVKNKKQKTKQSTGFGDHIDTDCSNIQLRVPLRGGWHVLLSQWRAAASPSIYFFFFQGVSYAPNQSSFPPPSPAPALRHVRLQVVP